MSCTQKMTLERRVAQRIFDEADAQRITLKRLAELTGIEPMRIYHLSRLSGSLRIDEFYRMSKVLGIPMERFIAEAVADGQREV